MVETWWCKIDPIGQLGCTKVPVHWSTCGKGTAIPEPCLCTHGPLNIILQTSLSPSKPLATSSGQLLCCAFPLGRRLGPNPHSFPLLPGDMPPTSLLITPIRQPRKGIPGHGCMHQDGVTWRGAPGFLGSLVLLALLVLHPLVEEGADGQVQHLGGHAHASKSLEMNFCR